MLLIGVLVLVFVVFAVLAAAAAAAAVAAAAAAAVVGVRISVTAATLIIAALINHDICHDAFVSPLHQFILETLYYLCIQYNFVQLGGGCTQWELFEQ